jgi:hypothetical protein
MSELFAAYGTKAAIAAAMALGWLLAKFVYPRVGDWADRTISRALSEVQDAVLEVSQTYADAIKSGKQDGKLTDEEAAEAKRRAIAIAKSNIGAKGLARLGRVLGIGVDGWLGTKVEATVKTLKAPPAAG